MSGHLLLAGSAGQRRETRTPYAPKAARHEHRQVNNPPSAQGEITFSHDEWEQSRELYNLVKGGRGYATYMGFACDMLMHGSVHTLRVTTDPATFRPDIARIGNNINQIAHYCLFPYDSNFIQAFLY